MAPVVPVLMLVSAAVSAYGAYQQGQAGKKAGAFNAQIAAQNAEIARRDAAAQAMQQDRENRQRLGAMRANIGASGGVGGSALDVLGDTASQGELAKQTIIYQGEQQARGFRNTAALETFSGKNAARAGTMRAASELLSGVARVGAMRAAGESPSGGAGAASTPSGQKFLSRWG